MTQSRCRLGHQDHLGENGRRECDRTMLRCGRCRHYEFVDWGWRLCGTCWHALARGGRPGRRWLTALGKRMGLAS